MLDPELVTRARGALLGLVAGNQLGVPTEHLGTPAAIRAAYPGGVRDPATPPKGSPYDDDAAMALLLAESLDERCLWGAVAGCLAARELLHGNIYFIDEVTHRVADRAPKILRDALHRVPREKQEDLPIAVPGEFGYVVHCVEIAFWFAMHDRSLEDSLIYLANAGGDTDTNAAVAGALLGARYGESAIPPRWTNLIAGATGVRELADRLVGADGAASAS